MRQLAKNKRPSVYYGGGAKNEETAGGGVRASTMLAGASALCIVAAWATTMCGALPVACTASHVVSVP